MRKIVYLMVAVLLAVSVTACKQQTGNETVPSENSVQSVMDESSAILSQNEPMPDASEYSDVEMSEADSKPEFIEPIQTKVSDYQSVVVNDKCRLLLYKGNEQRIIVPDKVTVDGKEYQTEIGAGCFRDTEITSLTLPDNITEIPESMCENCKKLEEVTFANVQSIKKNAFWKCENLKFRFSDLNFGDQTKLKKIGDCAFGFSGMYGKVIIRPDMEIEEGSFQVCQHIQEVEIQNGITAIPDRAFADDWEVSKITLPDTLISIGQCAFKSTIADTIVIPKSVTEIGYECISTNKTSGGKYNGIILGYKGSAAEQYANKNGIIFSPLD